MGGVVVDMDLFQVLMPMHSVFNALICPVTVMKGDHITLLQYMMITEIVPLKELCVRVRTYVKSILFFS